MMVVWEYFIVEVKVFMIILVEVMVDLLIIQKEEVVYFILVEVE